MEIIQYAKILREAIETLVAACCDDYVNSLLNEPSMRINVARSGFKGFANMRPVDLIQCARDAGLDERDYDVYAEGKVVQAITLLGGDDDAVGEWVGQHYGHNFDAMPQVERMDWRLRYVESV